MTLLTYACAFFRKIAERNDKRIATKARSDPRGDVHRRKRMVSYASIKGTFLMGNVVRNRQEIIAHKSRSNRSHRSREFFFSLSSFFSNVRTIILHVSSRFRTFKRFINKTASPCTSHETVLRNNKDKHARQLRERPCSIALPPFRFRSSFDIFSRVSMVPRRKNFEDTSTFSTRDFFFAIVFSRARESFAKMRTFEQYNTARPSSM